MKILNVNNALMSGKSTPSYIPDIREFFISARKNHPALAYNRVNTALAFTVTNTKVVVL